MTEQVFITSRQCLNPRWQEAFEQARYCPLEDVANLSLDAEDVLLWFDISQLPAEQRMPLLMNVRLMMNVQGLSTKVMVMTDEQSDTEAMQVMQSGAVGYCHYLAAPEQLQEIASVVKQGGLWIGAQLMQKLLMMANKTSSSLTEPDTNVELEKRLEQLTPRERMVAIEVGKGSSNKEIAVKLDITERTVKAHISVIFEKLEVRDRVKLALLINDLSKSNPLLSLSTMA